MNKLTVMEKINCCFYNTDDVVKTLTNCVCGKLHRFHYKKSEFDKSKFDPNKSVKLYRFCQNKPIELHIIKMNKDQKTKIDWEDKDAVRIYKRDKKREKAKRATPPINSLDNDSEDDTPVNTTTPKKKVVIIKKKIDV